jgi:5-methyltetrahydropteroyltriglutamate--homocysteine methyltransferase
LLHNVDQRKIMAQAAPPTVPRRPRGHARPELQDARIKAKRGEITSGALRQVEDKCIRDVVAFQESVGLQSITDGEYRRDWWHIDFLRGFDGVETIAGRTFGVQFQGADEQPPLMKVRAGSGAPGRACSITSNS